VPEDDPTGAEDRAAIPGDASRTSDSRDGADLHDLAAAFDAHDHQGEVEAAGRLTIDVKMDLFGPTSFVPVFLLAMTTVLVVPLGSARGIPRLVAVVFAAATLLAAIDRSRMRRRPRRILRILVAVGFTGAVLANGAGGLSDHPTLLKVVDLLTATTFLVLLVIAIALCLRELLHHRTISFSSLGAAMSAYLLLGLLFATLFGISGILQDGRFFAQPTPATPSNLTYFSYITLTTVGYGDLSPGTDAARALAVAEAISGQIFLVTIVARVVSSFAVAPHQIATRPTAPPAAVLRAQRRATRRGEPPTDAPPD
jgi:hypothetical protein